MSVWISDAMMTTPKMTSSSTVRFETFLQFCSLFELLRQMVFVVAVEVVVAI